MSGDAVLDISINHRGDGIFVIEDVEFAMSKTGGTGYRVAQDGVERQNS